MTTSEEEDKNNEEEELNADNDDTLDFIFWSLQNSISSGLKKWSGNSLKQVSSLQ